MRTCPRAASTPVHPSAGTAPQQIATRSGPGRCGPASARGKHADETKLMALSTSSSDGSAPELMTVPGRGRGMSTLVTSAAVAAAALVVRIEGGGR